MPCNPMLRRTRAPNAAIDLLVWIEAFVVINQLGTEQACNDAPYQTANECAGVNNVGS